MLENTEIAIIVLVVLGAVGLLCAYILRLRAKINRNILKIRTEAQQRRIQRAISREQLLTRQGQEQREKSSIPPPRPQGLRNQKPKNQRKGKRRRNKQSRQGGNTDNSHLVYPNAHASTGDFRKGSGSFRSTMQRSGGKSGQGGMDVGGANREQAQELQLQVQDKNNEWAGGYNAEMTGALGVEGNWGGDNGAVTGNNDQGDSPAREWSPDQNQNQNQGQNNDQQEPEQSQAGGGAWQASDGLAELAPDRRSTGPEVGVQQATGTFW